MSICASCSLPYVLYFSRVFKLREHSRFINVANDVSFTAKANYREKLDSIVVTLESVKIDDDRKISIKFSHRYREKFESYATRRTLTRCLVSGDESGREGEGGGRERGVALACLRRDAEGPRRGKGGPKYGERTRAPSPWSI